MRARAWALLAVSGGISATPQGFRDWLSDSDADARQAARLFSALAGLGLARGSGWATLADEDLPRASTPWSKAILAAGQRRQSGSTDGDGMCEVECDARDMDHAVKIAADMRRVWMATGEHHV